jgi:hypothetical protein
LRLRSWRIAWMAWARAIARRAAGQLTHEVLHDRIALEVHRQELGHSVWISSSMSKATRCTACWNCEPLAIAGIERPGNVTLVGSLA